MIAEFIDVQDERWTDVLMRSAHDFYHLPGYIELSARYESGKPAAFYAEEGDNAFLIPLLIRDVPEYLDAPDGCYDAATPYGYPSPVMVSAGDSPSLSRFLDAFKKAGAENGIVAAFFRMHPLLPLPDDVLAKHGTLVKHGQTVYIDLSMPSEEILAQVCGWHRKDIRKLVRLGFQTKIDDWGLLEEFVIAYHATMKRLSAREFYMFPESYFKDMRSALGGHLHLCTVLSPEGEVAAAGLFTVINGMVQYHLLGTSDKYLNRAPSKLACKAICDYARDTGNRVFHLGGGLGGRQDSLFEHKAGFSELRADFYTYRMVLDTSTYETLDHLYKAKYENIADNENNYFPAYRNPFILEQQAMHCIKAS